jgi:hypothetical protein
MSDSETSFKAINDTETSFMEPGDHGIEYLEGVVNLVLHALAYPVLIKSMATSQNPRQNMTQ